MSAVQPNGDAKPPRLWLLLGDKVGDNEQCLAAAEALGWSYETRHLVYNKRFRRWNILLGESLDSLDRGASDPLEATWPEMIFAVGRRSVPVARWIKAAAGGGTRLVHFGRPRAPLGWFDLIASPIQYGLPVQDNVVHLTLPPVRPRGIDRTQLDRWAQMLAGLPRPRILIGVGGRGDPFRFDERAAIALADGANRLARASGGSLLIATSRRSEPAAIETLMRMVEAPHFLHRWVPQAGENPYGVFLALADRFIVTSDSASMIADALATGKPVAMAPASYRPSDAYRLLRAAEALGPLYRCAHDVGLLAGPRRLDRTHRALIDSGRVVWLAQETVERQSAAGGADAELAGLAQRIRRLWAANSAIVPPRAAAAR